MKYTLLLLTLFINTGAFAAFTQFPPTPIPPSSLSAKGDIFSHDGAADAVLTAGTNNYVLVRDDIETTGLKWIPFPVSVTVDTKGDIQSFDTVPAKLAVGTDGSFLVADSTTATGLAYTDTLSGTLNPVSDIEEFTPSFTNLTLGAGGETKFTKSRVGDKVFVSGFIRFGTGGALTGTLYMDMPDDADASKFGKASFQRLDSITYAYDISTGVADDGRVLMDGSSLSRVYIISDGSSGWNATSPLTWTLNDEIYVHFNYPVLGWSSGTDAVVQNINRDISFEVKKDEVTGTTLVNSTWTTIAGLNASEVERGGDNYNTANSKFTAPIDGSYIFTTESNIAGMTASAGTAFIGFSIDGATPLFYKTHGVGSISGGYGVSHSRTIHLTAGQTVEPMIWQNSSSPANIATTGGPNTSFTGALTDGSNVLVGTFGNCQTKYLTANVSAAADITDLAFSNLVIGRKYKATGQILNDQGTVFRFIHDVSTVAQMFNQAGGQFGQPIVTPIFTATATTLRSRADTAFTIYGNGLGDKSWVELCEESKGTTTQY